MRYKDYSPARRDTKRGENRGGVWSNRSTGRFSGTARRLLSSEENGLLKIRDEGVEF